MSFKLTGNPYVYDFNHYRIYKQMPSHSHVNGNEYERVINILSYTAINYLTTKYDFIRSTFVDFQGIWATQLLDDLPTYSLTMDSTSYNILRWENPEYPLQFINAVAELFNNFNDKTKHNKGTVGFKNLLHPNTTSKVSLSHPEGVDENLRLGGTTKFILLKEICVDFKVNTVGGTTFYYIDNAFMNGNTTYEYHTRSKDDSRQSVPITNILYDYAMTTLTQLDDVLSMNNHVNSGIMKKMYYNISSLEQYMNDANSASGFKLF
jgi:hypothetical protein